MTLLGGGLLAVGLLIAACGGTSFQQTWVEPTAAGKILNRIAVVGVAENPAVLTEFEDTFARTLQKRGNDVVAGHTLFPDSLRGRWDEIRRILFEGKFDALLITRLAPAEVAPPAPGTAGLEPTLQSPGSPDAKAGTGGVTGEAGGAAQKVRLTTRLFHVSSADLLWEGTTASSRSSSIRDDVAAFSKTVSLELFALGLIR